MLGIDLVLFWHWSPQLFVLPESAHTSSIVRRETRHALQIVGPEVKYGRQPYQTSR
jgi:D-alanyl-lipoteichoic acid acyltransferase DltB (MBOAT superfamily)